MGGIDLRRGVRWLAVVTAALGLASATALAAPPQGDFTVNPNPPNRGEPAVFQCQPCPGSTSVAWDFSGGPSFERSGRSQTITFQTAGPRTVRMRLRRDGEETIVTKTVTVNAPPTVSFDFNPASPYAGEEVQFASQVSDPENDPVSLAWSFGDEAAGTGVNPRHAYAQAGTFTVRLTATDSHGAASSTTRQVTVRSDPGPSASFDFAPTVPNVGETVTFDSTSVASQGSITALNWDLDGDGQFDDFSGPTAAWAFDSPGAHNVRLRVEQTNGMSAVALASLRVNGLPSADFTWSPASPAAGASVDLVSTSTDAEGALAGFSWDLDGDGKFGDGSNPQVRQPFPEPGTYDIGLQVTDSDGEVRTVRKQLVVRASELPGAGFFAPGSGAPVNRRPALRLRFMAPFPVVRIAGTVMPRGSLISVLSVRAPRGARVRVRCLGSGCPVGSVATTSAKRIVRFRRFERRLPAGTRLRVFVRQPDRIGKYTSFLIRAGDPPKRVDLCLFPTERAPRRCP